MGLYRVLAGKPKSGEGSWYAENWKSGPGVFATNERQGDSQELCSANEEQSGLSKKLYMAQEVLT